MIQQFTSQISPTAIYTWPLGSPHARRRREGREDPKERQRIARLHRNAPEAALFGGDSPPAHSFSVVFISVELVDVAAELLLRSGLRDQVPEPLLEDLPKHGFRG